MAINPDSDDISPRSGLSAAAVRHDERHRRSAGRPRGGGSSVGATTGIDFWPVLTLKRCIRRISSRSSRAAARHRVTRPPPDGVDQDE